MKFLTNMRQTLRAPARAALSMLLLALITAFFCLSLNLWRNSEENLRLADETYRTIAVMELYADVDARGNLWTESGEEYAGYLPTAVTGYDLASIIAAPGVIRCDLRARYGAYIPGEVAIRPMGITSFSEQLFNFDIIRFIIDAEKPIELQNLNGTKLKIKVLGDAADCYHYADFRYAFLYITGMDQPENAAVIRAISGTADVPADTVLLRPGVEYLASIMVNERGAMVTVDGEPRMLADSIMIRPDTYGTDMWIFYSMQSGELLAEGLSEGQPFAMQLYDDVLSNAELREYYEQAKNAYYISARSFGVMATDDVLGVPAFHLGSTFMQEGRIFTGEEYDSGEAVCMVSTNLAKAQGWSVGDVIDMSFYEYDCFLNETYRWTELAPIYRHAGDEGFFDRGKYTIVGIYDLRPAMGGSTVSETALSVPWNTIFVPKKSIRNAPAEETLPVSGALLTLWLKNGSIDEFLGEMDALGLTGQKEQGYEARFTFYDQGYSKIQPSLVALSGTAELLLIASLALLLCGGALLALFYALSQRQNLGVMRMLGCSKAKAFRAALLSAMFICILGACAGALAGHMLTERVGAEILANAVSEPAANDAFSAFLAADQEIAIEFALGANINTSLFALLATLALFLLPLCGFVLAYLRKGPRELLPQGRE
ncbi:MAG: FtsX-like permease family protein [Firmicutes bacterium ADurb.Bin248]|nr:MAG: FtsX-like permease family protein [Firmicutes bacterium ADurb.Bin248]HOF99920.1 ABC transporter permease [Clostridia bacterium]HPK14417.1 ABC transporter permease [Clostridia bacterium]